MHDKKVIFTIFILIAFIIGLLILFLILLIFLYQKKQNIFHSQLENQKILYEKEILKSQMEVQDQTLKHISREIHDNIGQYITLAKLHLNTAEIPEESPDGKKVGFAVDLLTKSLEDLRDLSKSLSLELITSSGLPKAIENQVDQLRKSQTYTISFDIEGNYNYLDDQKEIVLFRILQEALNNIIKHAQAKCISIILRCTTEQIALTVCDDGLGFKKENYLNAGKTYNHSGGLSNMIARASLINADLQIFSSPEKGTRIDIKLPLNSDDDNTNRETS